MTDVVSHLRDAGFTDDEISAWSASKRNTLKAGGFTDEEVDDYLGLPKTPKQVPKGLVDRILQATDFSQSISQLPQAVTDIPHEAIKTTVEAVKGVANDILPESLGGARKPGEEGQVEGLAKTGQAIMGALAIPFAPLQGAIRSLAGHPFVATSDALRAGGVALYGEDKVAKAEAAAGLRPGGETYEDAKKAVDTALMAAGTRNLQRIGMGPAGVPEITPIGGLPQGEDFSTAGRAIGNGDTTPLMEQKLGDLYQGKGVHPAEVAHDAQTDPTITQSVLSTDKEDMPKAYGEDILTEKQPQSAGAAAAPQPTYTDAEKQILSKISIDEKAPEAKLTWDKLYTNVLDKLYPISKAVKQADLADLAPEDNPYNLARLMSGSAGKADHFLNNSTFDFTSYENNGASLKSILNLVRGDLNGFRAYATAARALELEDRGIKSGFAEEAAAPPLISAGLDAARAVVVDGREKFEKPFRDLIAYQNRVSQYLKDSGVLSQAGYDAMVEANKMYVPFTRVMGLDETATARGTGGSTLQAKNPIKAIKGSARAIVDPIESIVRNTYHFVEMAEKNQVGTKLVDMLLHASAELPEAAAGAIETITAGTADEKAIAEALQEIGLKDVNDLAVSLFEGRKTNKANEISVLRNGKRKTYQVDPDLARAMKGLDAQSMGMLEKVLSYPASMLRAGAVTTPDFALRHTIRDFLYAATTFKGGVFSPIDMAKGFAGLIMKDDDFWNWMKGGGGNVSMVGMDRQYLQADIRKLTGQTGLAGRAWNVLTDPDASMWNKTSAVGKLPFQAIDKFVLDPLRAATAFAESASHLGAFKKTMRASEGDDLRSQIIRSAWASRDTAVDAARMGANMRAYNMITAFANIKMQDTDRVVRAIKDNPISSLTKIGAAITVPSVVLWAANHDDPRYAEIPQWQKDMFWLVMTPEHVFRIPKPWAMGMVFGSGPERLLDAFVANKPDAFKEYFKSIWAASGPDFVPTAASPIVDQFANRSTFTNRTLIPSAQEKFLPEYQYTPYTTELTKALGRMIGAFPGMTQLKMDNSGFGGTARALTSPILMENYIRGWTGTLGVYALQAADKGLRMAGKLPDPPQPASTLADIPIIRAFVVRYPSASAESVQTFYDAYDKNKAYFDTWNAMAKDGNVAAMSHIQDMGGPMMFAQLDGIKQTLTEHNQIIRDIYKNPNIKPDEKRQLIDQLYGSMIQISRYGNDAVRQMQEQAANLVSKPR